MLVSICGDHDCDGSGRPNATDGGSAWRQDGVSESGADEHAIGLTLEDGGTKVLGERRLRRVGVSLDVGEQRYAERVAERPAEDANTTGLAVRRGGGDVVLLDERLYERRELLTACLEERCPGGVGAVLKSAQVGG